MTPATGEADLSFDRLLRYATGRRDESLEAAMEASPDLRELADQLSRMVSISRRSTTGMELPVAGSWFQRQLLADDGTPIPPTALLKLVFDSWSGEATALRAVATQDVRFLRYDGEFSVELQVRTDGGSTEIRGQVTPHRAATWGVLVPNGHIEREFRIAEDGTFVVGDLPAQPIELDLDLDFGSARITDLTL